MSEQIRTDLMDSKVLDFPEEKHDLGDGRTITGKSSVERVDGMTRLPFGPPIYVGKLANYVVHEVQSAIDKVRSDPERDFGDRLAGRIIEQLNISDIVSDRVYGHLMLHTKNFLEGIETATGYAADELLENLKQQQLGVDALWVNIQKAKEYNPPHVHDGMFSFVFYVQNDIPYEEAIQNHYDNQKGQQLAGSLECRYGEHIWMNFSQFQHYPNVGDIIMFPSWLQHSVHQFYQEDRERISVAGNIQQFYPPTIEE